MSSMIDTAVIAATQAGWRGVTVGQSFANPDEWLAFAHRDVAGPRDHIYIAELVDPQALDFQTWGDGETTCCAKATADTPSEALDGLVAFLVAYPARERVSK